MTAIVTAHHGTRTAYARPDGGLDIVLTLPAPRGRLADQQGAVGA